MIAACFVLAIFILVMIVVVVTLECTAEEAPPAFVFATVSAVVALCVLAIIQFGISV